MSYIKYTHNMLAVTTNLPKMLTVKYESCKTQSLVLMLLNHMGVHIKKAHFGLYLRGTESISGGYVLGICLYNAKHLFTLMASMLARMLTSLSMRTRSHSFSASFCVRGGHGVFIKSPQLTPVGTVGQLLQYSNEFCPFQSSLLV